MKYQFETERLLLRNYEETDLDDYFEIVKQEEVCSRLGFPAYKTKEDAKKRLEIEMKKPTQFAIVLKDKNKVVGSIELKKPEPGRYDNIKFNDDAMEIGFLLSSFYWNNGYMTEAAKAVTKFAFENLGVSQVIISHKDKNVNSSKVQDKLGFKIIGIFDTEKVWIDGTKAKSVQRIMSKDEFLNNQNFKDFKFRFKIVSDGKNFETIKAGCVLLNKKTNEIGLIYREELDDFSFPKGHLEIGETIKECAVRETAEETKRNSIIIDEIEPYENRYITPKGEHCVVYTFVSIDIGHSEIDSEDTHTLVWTPIDEVEEKLSYDNLKELWQYLSKKIKKYLNK